MPQLAAETLAPLDSAWNASLLELAERCRQLNRADLATRTDAWRTDRQGKATRIYLHTDEPMSQPQAGDQVAAFWQQRIEHLRKERASELLVVAKSVAKQHGDLGFQLCHEALQLDPEHPVARALLGQRANLARDAAVRRPPLAKAGIREHYRIRTPHFEILSEAGETAGRELAREAEALFAAWSQLFFEWWSDGETLQRRLDSPASIMPSTGRLRVVLFQDRERYLAALRPKEPRIEVSVGLYLPADRTSYFYADKEDASRTWRHELTHQLFAEVRRTAPNAGLRRNYWLLEGIAMYMESLQLSADSASEPQWLQLGGPGVDRLQFARLRRAPDRAALLELIKMGRGDMQRRQDLSELYSNAAGVTCFLMDGQRGQLRKSCVKLLELTYQGRDDDDSLLQLSGHDVDSFVAAYHEFLADMTDADMAQLGPVRNLCLRGTAVTAAGLRQLDASRLKWLDVAGRPYGDDDLLAALGKAKQLEQLNVEATQVTDALLVNGPLLQQRWPALRELDLSATAVTDAAVQRLTMLSLDVLWLNQTRLTAAGCRQLGQLQSLRTLGVAGLPIDGQDVERLKRDLPHLEAIHQ
ncbi:MAG: hypothetical protein KDB14_16445 [Planctomycetales bacterium]|nr:hypothetical protein [Planctomycetales bacterium]